MIVNIKRMYHELSVHPFFVRITGLEPARRGHHVVKGVYKFEQGGYNIKNEKNRS